MKAPDKIYMPNELLSEEWQRHIEGEDVEYVRTDVLIEKACAYLDSIGHRYIIDAFRKYMKE